MSFNKSIITDLCEIKEDLKSQKLRSFKNHQHIEFQGSCSDSDVCLQKLVYKICLINFL